MGNNKNKKFISIVFYVFIGLFILKLHSENIYPHACKVNHLKEKEDFNSKDVIGVYSCETCGFGTMDYYMETTKMYQSTVDKINKEKYNTLSMKKD